MRIDRRTYATFLAAVSDGVQTVFHEKCLRDLERLNYLIEKIDDGSWLVSINTNPDMQGYTLSTVNAPRYLFIVKRAADGWVIYYDHDDS